MAVLCGLGLLALLYATGLSRATASRAARAGLLVAGTLFGWCLQLALLNLERDGVVSELTRRTESGSFTSYYTVATRGPGRDPADFLARHHQVLPGLRKGTLHAATHPPGPVLYYAGLAALHARWEWLRDRVTVPLLGSVLLGLLGALAAFPVAALGRRLTGDPGAGTRLGLLWPLVPGVALMVPQFDQALALLVAGSVACLAVAVHLGERPGSSPRGRVWMAAALAGGSAGLAFFVSYGSIALVAIGALAVLVAVWGDPEKRPRIGRAVAISAGTGLLVMLVPAIWEHAPWRSLPVALSIHREQFTAPRSYLAWLFFNPWDVTVFLGLPVVLVGLAHLREAQATHPARVDQRFRVAAVVGLTMLFLSGTLRGESGRILAALMPVLLVAALSRPAPLPQPAMAAAVLVGAFLLSLDIALRLAWQLP
jgi:hypothetical protein